MGITAKPTGIINSRARALRFSSTDAERLLWASLRRRQLRGFYFRRQQPFGPYIVDFYCNAASLAIELDGGQHLEHEQRASDRDRDYFLAQRSIRVVRFFNDDVLTNLPVVLEAIARELAR